jgi:thiol:disulfide interchange protein DsbG
MKPMTLTKLFFPAVAALTLTLSGCSKPGEPTATTAAPTAAPSAAPAATTASASSYDLVANTGKGFTVGSMMSAQPVYVVFEPQCPHCGHLWQASIALQGKVKFVWIPIAFNNGKNLAQAVTLLSSSTPLETMTEHEQSLTSGKGGILPMAGITAEQEQAIKTNSDLLTKLGQDSVPFIVAKNRLTGEIVSHSGAMDTATLAKFIGVD